MAAALLILACSLAWESSARRVSTAAALSAVMHISVYNSQRHAHIIVLAYTDCPKNIPSASSSRLLISVMSSSATPSFCFRSATSVAWAVARDVTACVSISQIISWAYLSQSSDRLPLDANQSLRGYYLYTGAFCVYSTIEYITLHT